ncbi:MAG: Bug family tripartite tricarboxylate transporter substrate binding protein [Lautropia sp.]
MIKSSNQQRRSRISFKSAGLVCSILLATLSMNQAAVAQDGYPSRTIMLSAGFAAGGPTDIVARALAQKLGAILGQSVVVENRPGADGRIQLQHLANAAPDGYQLGLVDAGLIINSILYKNLPYKVKDFTPITYLGELANFIAVTPSLKLNTLTDFLSYAKANPGKLNYGATATAQILATEQLIDMTKLSMERVQYKGASAAIPALMSGEIHALVSVAGTLAPMGKEGRVKVLAVTAKQRSSLMPEVPTTAEAGLPGYTFANWYVIAGPANMPPAIADKVNGAVLKMLTDRDLVAQLERMGITVEPASGAKLVEFMDAEHEKVSQLTRKLNFKAE